MRERPCSSSSRSHPDPHAHISYKIGDAFIYVPGAEALTLVERDTERVEAELQRLAQQQEEAQKEMDKLKVALYAKFGDNISELVAMLAGVSHADLSLPCRSGALKGRALGGGYSCEALGLGRGRASEGAAKARADVCEVL